MISERDVGCSMVVLLVIGAVLGFVFGHVFGWFLDHLRWAR